MKDAIFFPVSHRTFDTCPTHGVCIGVFSKIGEKTADRENKNLRKKLKNMKHLNIICFIMDIFV